MSGSLLHECVLAKRYLDDDEDEVVEGCGWMMLAVACRCQDQKSRYTRQAKRATSVVADNDDDMRLGLFRFTVSPVTRGTLVGRSAVARGPLRPPPNPYFTRSCALRAFPPVPVISATGHVPFHIRRASLVNIILNLSASSSFNRL